MRRSKNGLEAKKSSHRRSWLNNNPLFSMFSSAPSSPERRSSVELVKHRSNSLSPNESPTIPPLARPAPLKSSKSTLSSILSKASSKAKKKHARKESSQTTFTFTDYSSIYGSSCSSNRRSSSKSDATVVSDLDPYPIHYRYYQKSNPNLIQDSAVSQQQLIRSDEEEADRIQLKNDLVKLAFEGEFSLPFDYQKMKTGRVLDIGCGPGSWCIDLSTTYPNIHVVGVDSEDMFPSKHSLPNNCELIVCNVLNGLKEFPDASFDVIHIRFMVLAFTTRQYYQVVKDCWRLLKPKGFLEIFETDLTVYSAGPVTQKLNQESRFVCLLFAFNGSFRFSDPSA
ncbi:S-adenosyl-L-methionine-dependent methyltransferase [Blakeslea trispora]|nr:S-adenosyl-L-methionine-dependent methyltransferase [Blakeslea trispora]